ncbi:MAG TPA: ATP-dependent protease subunit HslV [Atribacterota bacterium]|nr:ATP-dependent protease subunit HslV [Atribacterota bacterium]HZK11271.1 ATP-dependent protease subunit HslV [Atribacterota bacterium]
MFKGTTILAIKHKGETAISGDGQISMGNTIMKNNTIKIRKIYEDKVLTGFAGASADAITLFEKFETKINEFHGNLPKAVISLAKEWRTDKILRKLEAILIVADKEKIFVVSGTGDIIEPDDDIAAIGSGGPYALAAAKALVKYSKLSAYEIALESLKIAASICIYTNDKITVEKL